MIMSVDGIAVSHYSDSNQDKMVKKVIDYKLLNGKRYYKVKWECTWELEDSLLSCQGLVDQFWNFVNRVKSEDSPIPLHEKSQFNENIICMKGKNIERNNCSDDVSHQIIHHEKPKPNELQDSQKLNSDTFHTNDDVIRETTVNIKPAGKEGNMVDENNLPSMVTINPPRQALQISCAKDGIGTPGLPQHPSSVFKRSYGIRDGNSDENYNQPHEVIDLKMQRPHLNGNGVGGEERRFQCHVCGMAFKRKDMCKRHLRTHTNDCCYFCSICKKGFIRRYVLMKHLNKDHQTNDQTKILSTKRRRRDDVKQEKISNLPISAKNETHSLDPMPASEYILESSENLSIDEHDYDKKKENVVVVFKVESDESKTESTCRTYEYSEKHLNAENNIDLHVNTVEEIHDNSAFIETAVIAPLNNQSEHEVGVNISSVHHEAEKSVGDGTYVMVSRNNVSLPENLQNVPYNTQFTFSAKETGSNQSCSQHE